MISRIYIDNYKCFTNFEYHPGNLQLLLGGNGTGKTAVFEVLELLGSFLVEGLTTQLAFRPIWRRPGINERRTEV